MPSAQDPKTGQSDHQPEHMINPLDAIFAQPLSDQDTLSIETPLTDAVTTTQVMMPEQPLFQHLHPVSRGGRGHYENVKNPVQMLASLIRKADTKISESVTAETPALAQPVLTDIPRMANVKSDTVETPTLAQPVLTDIPHMANVKSDTAETPALAQPVLTDIPRMANVKSDTVETPALAQPVITTDIISGSMLSPEDHQLMGPFASPATAQAPNTPHIQTNSDPTQNYGPFPKNNPMADSTGKALAIIADIPHMANVKTETDVAKSVTEAVIPKPETKPETGMEQKIQLAKRDVPIDKISIMRGTVKNADNNTADEQSMMASSLKSSQITSSALSSSSPSSVGAHLSSAAMQSSGTEHGGGFSGQQQSGQQGSQQNPKQGQPDISVDSRMGLDQGKDGRLLRLNMADTNWTDRLLRHIEGKTSDTGGETIRVILEPAKLGRLMVQISVIGQTSHVQITSATAEAAALLADAEPKLQQALEQNGMKLGQMQTSTQGFSHQWSNQHGSQQGSKDSDSGSSGDGNDSNIKNAPQGEEESTKILENAKTGKVNILA
jgi:flagellar hook-length control protein FliK